MKTGIIIGILIVLALIILIFAFGSTGNQNNVQEKQESPSVVIPIVGSGEVEETTNTGSESSSTHDIEITSSGFSPKTLEINAGDTVTWTNKDSRNHWPASAIHPTHTVYPGSSISKCGTSAESEIFDACNGLSAGESYSFTFNEKGTWKYHDHLSISRTGTIIVN